MSQAPFIDSNQYPNLTTIQDGSGSFVEQFVGAALLALATQNSGPVEPSPAYPLMVWADTSTNILKFRNLTNTAWISYMDLNTGNLLTNAATASAVSLASTATSATTATGLSGAMCSYYLGTNQAIAGSDVVHYDTVLYDPSSVYSTSTYQATPGVGLYLVTAQASFTSTVLGAVQIRVNGGVLSTGADGGSASTQSHFAAALVNLTAPTDYIDFRLASSAAGTINSTILSQAFATLFNIVKLK